MASIHSEFLSSATRRRRRGGIAFHTQDNFFLKMWKKKSTSQLAKMDDDIENVNLRALSPQINMRMRSILVAWMYEVCITFHLNFSSFMAAVDYLDRFLLSYVGIERKRLQLVGVTALWIGSKMIEVHAPPVRDMSYICDNAYTIDEVLQMERTMVASLRHSLRTRRIRHKSDSDHFAMALYVMRRSSLTIDCKRVQRIIRGLQYILKQKGGWRPSPSTRRQRQENAITFLSQLHDYTLNLDQICVKIGVSIPSIDTNAETK